MSKENKAEETAEESTDQKSAEVKVEKAEIEKANKPASNGFIYFLILLVIAGLVAAAYYFWEEQKNQNTLLKQQADQILMFSKKINSNDTENNKRDEAIAQNNKQLQVAVENADEAIAISQQATVLVNRAQREWVLAEVDYLLRIAHRRLDIARDIGGAVAALKGADSRLQELSDLKLFNIRKQLAKDIADLRAVHQADVAGIALEIDQVMAHINELPFKSVQSKVQAQLEKPANTETLNTANDLEKTFIDSVIATVKQIGDIKIHQRSLELDSTGIQHKQIEQLLYTHFISLRLAALNYNQQSFMYEVERIAELLDKYYDGSSDGIKQLKVSMDNYKKIQLSPILPELIKAWEMLQEEMNKPVNKVQQEAE